MAVALYARVSTTRQAENELSIPDQLKQLRNWCKANGHLIGHEYVEAGASATDDSRPAFQEMIADAVRSPSPYTFIVVHSRSRFFRDLYQFLFYEKKLKAAGIRVISITQQTSDDATGEMSSQIISMFDEHQSAENSKHTKRAMQENARQGYWNGSVPPYGFRATETQEIGNRGRKKRKLTVDATEAEVVLRIYDLYLNGHHGSEMGMKNIATHLNAQGIRMRGRRWSIQKINQLLRDKVYIGCFYFNRRDSKTGTIRPQSEWIPVEVPAIVPDHLFEAAAKRRASQNPKSSVPRAVSSPAPLVGLLKCGHCGANMTQATGKSGLYRYYKCTARMNKSVAGCGSRNLPREKTDALVMTALGERIFTPARVNLMLKEMQRRQRASRTVEDGQLIKLKKELDSVSAGLTNLYDAVAKGLMPLDDTLREHSHQMKARRDNVLLEMGKLKDRHEMALRKVDMPSVQAFCGTLKQTLAAPGSSFGKAYLRLLVDEIRLEGNELKIKGGYGRLADAIGSAGGPKAMKLGMVPSFISNWRARQDSNPRPLGS